MGYTLGILDQSPIFPNESAEDALQHTIELAKDAEEWGYNRFWVSEHHNMEKVAGTSPEILISHLLAHTNTINIGSGGVMLQHYSPYKVVESFNVLAALAPGRVDLGIGKAPGGLDLSTKALQHGAMNEQLDFKERLKLVNEFIHSSLPEKHALQSVKAMPQPEVKPNVYLLGASENSAQQAAEMHMEFVFARFLNSNDIHLLHASEKFRANYKDGKFTVAVSVLAAETTEEAIELSKELKLYEITFSNNRTLLVQSYDQVLAQKKQTNEPFEVREKEVHILAGTAEEINAELDKLHRKYDIDEFILHTPLPKITERRKSFDLLSPKKNILKGKGREKVSN